jgi:hypothetical protein
VKLKDLLRHSDLETRRQARLVQRLLDVERGLSEWEMIFADSAVRCLEFNDRLTKKQIAKIEEILEEKGQ